MSITKDVVIIFGPKDDVKTQISSSFDLTKVLFLEDKESEDCRDNGVEFLFFSLQSLEDAADAFNVAVIRMREKIEEEKLRCEALTLKNKANNTKKRQL